VRRLLLHVHGTKKRTLSRRQRSQSHVASALNFQSFFFVYDACGVLEL
jgi:hypothetical protein